MESDGFQRRCVCRAFSLRVPSPTTGDLQEIRVRQAHLWRISDQLRRQLVAAYPADPRDALEALTTATVAWPGAAVLWAAGRGTAADPWRMAALR
jgi:hypothetical protein